MFFYCAVIILLTLTGISFYNLFGQELLIRQTHCDIVQDNCLIYVIFDSFFT